MHEFKSKNINVANSSINKFFIRLSKIFIDVLSYLSLQDIFRLRFARRKNEMKNTMKQKELPNKKRKHILRLTTGSFVCRSRNWGDSQNDTRESHPRQIQTPGWPRNTRGWYICLLCTSGWKLESKSHNSCSLQRYIFSCYS